MRSVRAFTGMVAVAMLVALVPSARAAQCVAPPGRSAIVEYCETVPTAKKAPAHSHPAVPASTRRALRQAGPAGATVLALASGGPRAKRHAKRAATAPPAAVSGLSFSLGRVGSVGSLLLWILLAVAVVLAVAAWLRLRRRASAE